ncbi:MAG: hypothetical protein E4H14_17570 [Candidatus Thorarchaeota archaeon]|nr:MAG: hypothetical protein E4H14_17570 [Candidatus Thorarchaeota archaeon]
MTDDVEVKPEVRYLSVVRKEGGEPIIGIPYREMSVDPDLVASFVLAVIIFENRQLKNFTKEGYVVVIEEGEYVVGLLIVDRVDDDGPYRTALKKVIEKFENTYENQMIAWKGDIRPFREFALDILQVYPYRDFSQNMIPRLLAKSDATPDYQAQIPWSVGETDVKLQVVLGYINGKRTIEEIMNQSEYEDSEVLAILSMLERYKWIALTRKLEDSSILVKVMDPPKFLVGVYGEQLTSIMEQCDGKKTLAAICEALPYNTQAVKLVAKNLIDAGVLGYSDIDKEVNL